MADRPPASRYAQRLAAILKDIQAFYREGMQRCGFGSETFCLERDAQGRLVIHLVKGMHAKAFYVRTWHDRRRVIGAECRPMLQAAGISFQKDTVAIVCNLADWNAKTRSFRHPSPYTGSWTQQGGLCWLMDSPILNLDYLTRTDSIVHDFQFGDVPLGKRNSMFIGSMAHELGHAFGLPHCGERWDEKALGASIMGVGNLQYRDELRSEGKGAFLTMGSAMKLAARPLFSGSDKGITIQPRLSRCQLSLSTNLTCADLAHRRGALRLTGTVEGSPPIYGVIAYFDSLGDGGYHSPTATAVPDAHGRFAIEISDLAPCANGQLRVEFCHVNGGVSERRLGFSVRANGVVDLSQWKTRRALEPLGAAVAGDRIGAACSALAKLEQSQASKSATLIGRELVAALINGPRPTPADVPSTITRIALSDTQWRSAKVGWLQPAANRIPPNDQVTSPFLDCGRLYTTGLFAHPPSRYVFDLGRRWKTLRGEAGLHTAFQPYAFGVVFIIKADGKQRFQSPIIRGSKKVTYDLDVTGAKTLELIVKKAYRRNGGNWALWLNPVLTR